MNNTNSESCESCMSCYFSSSCESCESCNYCKYCTYCVNLKMTEHNYFCWAEEYNYSSSFQQKRYRVFNVEVSREEYEKIPKIYHKLEFYPNEPCETRFKTAFKKMWAGLSQEEKQEYFDIPYFNWEGFTFITGIEPEEPEEPEVTKAIKLLESKGKIKDGKIII